MRWRSVPAIGVSEATCELVLAALSGDRAVVLDADAMTSFAQSPAAARRGFESAAGKATILTPHEGEFSTIFWCLGRAN